MEKSLSPPSKSTTPRARKRKAESAALIAGSQFKKMHEQTRQCLSHQLECHQLE